MFRVLVIPILCLLSAGIGYCQKVSSQAQHEPINGEYSALEKMSTLSPVDHSVTWFHENTLLVRNNEAILDMVPVWTKRGKKFYSASDGGLLTYRARFLQRAGQAAMDLRLVQSDYTLSPAGKNPNNEIKTRRVRFGSGDIYIDGVRYRPVALNETKRNELLRLLDKEPLEKPVGQ